MRSLAAATTLAVLLSSAALTATPAFADSVKPVSALQDAFDMAVDGTHQRVFISDPSTNRIAVTDNAGTLIGTLTGLPQVHDLTLSPDDSTLYAAVSGADKIVAFDTATLTQTAEYPTGTGSIPSYVAYADGKLWFGHGEEEDIGLGVVDLTAETPTVTLDLAAGHTYYGQPVLLADPDNPGTLVALDAGVSSGPVIVYDITSDTPAIRVQGGTDGFPHDAALTPDGQNLITAGNGLVEYRLSDLAAVRTFPLAYQPESVSVAPDGTVAATVLDTDDAGDTYVFSTDPSKPANVRKLTRKWMPRGHLTNWSADGSKLFLVTDTPYTAQFRVVDEPRKYAATLKVNAPASAPRAKTLMVTSTLTANLALPAGTPITVTRTDLESPNGKSLGTKSLGTGGKFSFTDVPPAGGKVKYTVTYAGDAEHKGASATDTVDVSRATPTLTLNNNGKVYAYGQDVKFTAHLGTTYKNRTVEIWADPYGADKPNKLVKTGTVNSDGNLSVVVDLKRRTKLTAKFAGDARYAPKSTQSTVGAKVSISTSVTGSYKSTYTWGHTYLFFRQSKDPVVTAKLPPYEGRTQLLQIQYWSGTSWVTTYREYFDVDSAGRSGVQLTGTPPTGVRFRVRNSYVSGSGDNVNTTTNGSWKYFTFTG